MSQAADLSYIEQTETYIEKNKDAMPEVVYQFMQQVCKDERKMHQLAEEWSNKKGILKVPEAKAAKY